MIRTIKIFGWMLLLLPWLSHAQSLDRMVIGSAGECATVGGQNYTIFIGEAVVGTEQATLPALTMGFQQPRELSLLRPEFISFSARLVDDKANLEWEFPVHPQSRSFQVLRSLDGQNFDPTGIESPQNFGSKYAFTDRNISPSYRGSIQYQILWIGKNGERVLSQRLELYRGEGTDPIRVFPNPFSQTIMLQNPHSGKEISIRLTDVRGKICWQGSLKAQLSIPTTDLAKGMYQLHLSGEGINEYRKMIKK